MAVIIFHPGWLSSHLPTASCVSEGVIMSQTIVLLPGFVLIYKIIRYLLSKKAISN